MNLKTDRKVFELANAICDKNATEENIQELNKLMKDYPEARQIYLKVMDMHFDLDRMSLTGTLANSSNRCETLLGKLDKAESTKKKATHFILSIAALITISLSVFILSNAFLTTNYEAIVIESVGENWQIGTKFKINDQLVLKEDESVKLQFNDDTLIELTGPISTSLDKSDKNGRHFALSTPESTLKDKALILYSGDTVIQVTHSDKAYKSRFKVIESGNSYGIQFKNQLTEVHVFKGLVTSYAETSKLETQKIYHLQAAGFNNKGLLKKWTQPDYKGFNVQRTITGVKSTNKYVHWLKEKPISLNEGQLESNDSIFLIEEKKNITLPHEIPVTFSERVSNGKGGTQSAYSTHIRMLPKGTKVDSYLLHYDPAAKKFLDGDIYFDRPIVAVIARTDQLNYSDKLFALESVEYPTKGTAYRGLDDYRKGEDVDVLKYKADPKSIGIRFNIETDTIDQIRILIQSE